MIFQLILIMIKHTETTVTPQIIFLPKLPYNSPICV